MALALVAVAVPLAEPVYWWVTTRQIIREDAVFRVGDTSYPSWRAFRVRRWSAREIVHGRFVEYYDENHGGGA